MLTPSSGSQVQEGSSGIADWLSRAEMGRWKNEALERGMPMPPFQ